MNNANFIYNVVSLRLTGDIRPRIEPQCELEEVNRLASCEGGSHFGWARHSLLHVELQLTSHSSAVRGRPIESPVVEERPRGREVFLKPPQSPSLRRRCKSLPTPTERAKLEISRSRSPTSQKRVRFADSLGLELISVKHFDDTDEPEVPERILAKLSMLMELQEVKVLLETVQVDEFSMSGFVRVLNLAFEKSVSLRYSLNNWLTCMDSLASYVPDSSKGDTDKFRFKIVMPTYLDNGGTFQFAIKYCVGGTEFWDNNNGNNYKVRRHRFKMSPPREWENGWIHFI
uniref:CBM21 domain-containing protein n=1 Tax=Gasterosteus aculeatus aculeatus TaxID=481459 RepID=A0AAQ4PCP5_GASAC